MTRPNNLDLSDPRSIPTKYYFTEYHIIVLNTFYAIPFFFAFLDAVVGTGKTPGIDSLDMIVS